MPNRLQHLRRLAPAALALALVATFAVGARYPTVSAERRAAIATRFHFTEMPIAFPAGYAPNRHIRDVNPAYAQIQAWISSVGAAAAMNDLAGDGLADELCIVDPRTDQVVVTYAPDAATEHRFEPFVLDPAPLPMDPAMAPTGCVPGDFNEDARMDLLVYYMGRTPVLFLARSGVTSGLARSAYLPTELLSHSGTEDGVYSGPRWQTTAASIADYDGDGHADIFITNYFPDSDVLDPDGLANVSMPASMSNARNGGGAHVLRWAESTAGENPSVRYTEDRRAVPFRAATGWTLGVSSADLDDDVLPEVYLANDFGPDHLLYNVSRPGVIRFDVVEGRRAPQTPKSMVLGHDSFKGMAIDFGDLRSTGSFDMFVSNIATEFGLMESNLLWRNTAESPSDARESLRSGVAPFRNDATSSGLAWSGWAWDAKMADFDNSGDLSIVQANGFVKGEVNRWSWLQELAMSNDELVANPKMWPKAGDGDDIAGSERLAFYATAGDDKYADISAQLGLDVPVVTRGIATGDATGDGGVDFLVARQWGPPAYYHNDSPSRGAFLALRLTRPVDDAPGAGPPEADGLRGRGTPAYGAQVLVTTAEGRTHLAQVDGGGGHSGKRSFDIHVGLGDADRPVSARVTWRDRVGETHRQTLRLTPGVHDLVLDGAAKQVMAR